MINWCAYCQQFQGEVPPFDNYRLTHGMCSKCKIKGLTLTPTEFAAVQKLKLAQDRLRDAGISRDFSEAEEAIKLATETGARDLDILLGLIAPLLWETGDKWASGLMSVEEEHNFTDFYNEIIFRIQNRGMTDSTSEAPTERVDVLLLMFPGNDHEIGIRVFHHWLLSNGFDSRFAFKAQTPHQVVFEMKRMNPRYLAFSAALPEHISQILEYKEKIKNLNDGSCPPLLVGGNAVKVTSRLVAHPDVIFTQIGGELVELLRSKKNE